MTGVRRLFWVFCMAGRDPSTWAVFCCLAGTLTGNWIGNPYRMLVSQVAALAAMPQCRPQDVPYKDKMWGQHCGSARKATTCTACMPYQSYPSTGFCPCHSIPGRTPRFVPGTAAENGIECSRPCIHMGDTAGALGLSLSAFQTEFFKGTK